MDDNMITDAQRREIIHMLEWAEWAIRDHMEASVGEPWEAEAEEELRALHALWDSIRA